MSKRVIESLWAEEERKKGDGILNIVISGKEGILGVLRRTPERECAPVVNSTDS